MKSSENLRVDAFSMCLADINSVGLDRLHALSMSVGWPHRAEDWQFVREVGQGIAALDEIGRVLGSAMWFEYGGAFATVGMVITSPRLQALGAGQWLMQRVFEEVGERDLRLNATRAARRLYQSLDFQPDRTVYQCQGVARRGGRTRESTVRGDVRPLGVQDLSDVVALDAAGFGVDRRDLVEKLFAQSVGYGLFDGGKLRAFALCRPFGRGHVVGPVVAFNDTEAIAVVHSHLSDHADDFMRLDTPMENGAFAAFLSHNGIILYDTVLTMSKSKSFADFFAGDVVSPITYAIASQALG